MSRRPSLPARRIEQVRLVFGAAATIALVVVTAGCGGDKSGGSGGFPDGPAPTAAFPLTEPSDAKLQQFAKDAGCELKQNRNEGSTHKPASTPFKYEANPPTSGDHVSDPAQDGAYADNPPSVPSLIHGLEHGRVIVQWSKGKVTSAQIGSIKKLYEDEPYRLIIVPNETKMPYAVAATAWDNSLVCPKLSDKTFLALRQFHVNFQGRGPENVP